MRMFPGALHTVCAAVCDGLGFSYETISATSCLHVPIFLQREVIPRRVSSSRADTSRGTSSCLQFQQGSESLLGPQLPDKVKSRRRALASLCAGSRRLHLNFRTLH